MSDPAMKEALYEIASIRRFACLSLLADIPDEPMAGALSCRRLLERRPIADTLLETVNRHLAEGDRMMRTETLVDPIIIHASNSTASRECARGTETRRDASDREEQPAVSQNKGAHYRGYLY